MSPTEILSAEHRVIERVLDCLEKMAEQASRQGSLDPRNARQALEFLRTFADRCHHGKEEGHLFARLNEKGFPRDAGPVGVMLSEHDQGRALTRQMAEEVDAAEQGKEAAEAGFAHAARAYVDLLRAHIQKEDRVLFRMADQALNPAEQQQMLTAFEKTDREDIGHDVVQRMLAIAAELTSRFGVPSPDVAPGGGGESR